MASLFDPLQLRELKLRNRIVLSPMCQYSAIDGVPQPWHMAHYGARAAGGTGALILEATAVSPTGRISPDDLGLWDDEQCVAFRAIVSLIKEQGSVAGIQLAHAGRKACTAAPWDGGRPIVSGNLFWQSIGPSAKAFSKDFLPPTEMSLDDMVRVVREFSEAAARARLAGFDIVEIHMAHGYLLHQFLSPLSNERSDRYGGSLENRLRFPLEVANAVRREWPGELPVFVRVSATDWVKDAWDLDQTISLVQQLKSIGVDLIDVSSGGLLPDVKIPAGPGFQVQFAKEIKRTVEIRTGAVGLITEPAQAEKIIFNEDADLVFMGRELLKDPHWPLRAAKLLGKEISWPKQYLRAKD